jgi:hypothetical protein
MKRKKIIYMSIVGSIVIIILNFSREKFDAMNIMSIVVCSIMIIAFIMMLFADRKNNKS